MVLLSKRNDPTTKYCTGCNKNLDMILQEMEQDNNNDKKGSDNDE